MAVVVATNEGRRKKLLLFFLFLLLTTHSQNSSGKETKRSHAERGSPGNVVGYGLERKESSRDQFEISRKFSGDFPVFHDVYLCRSRCLTTHFSLSYPWPSIPKWASRSDNGPAVALPKRRRRRKSRIFIAPPSLSLLGLYKNMWNFSPLHRVFSLLAHIRQVTSGFGSLVPRQCVTPE